MIPLGFGWWMLWPYPCLLFAILISCRLNLWLMTRYWQLGRIGWNQSQIRWFARLTIILQISALQISMELLYETHIKSFWVILLCVEVVGVLMQYYLLQLAKPKRLTRDWLMPWIIAAIPIAVSSTAIFTVVQWLEWMMKSAR